MGIMVSKDLEQKSELNRRIASDLRTRTASTESLRDPDYDEDEMEGMKKTGKFTWVWIILVILAIISLICILFI